MMRPTSCYLMIYFIFLLCFCSHFTRKHFHHETPHAKKPAPPIPYNIVHVLNVEFFGAKADGKSDSSQAFKNAWDKACKSSESARILVPKGKIYYVKHIKFRGPCHSRISFEIQGTIKSFGKMYNAHSRLWINFNNVRNMQIFGGGTIDGNGEVWWNNSCKIKKTQPCQSQNAPTALTFKNIKNLTITNLKLLNAQQMHVNFKDCNDVVASKLLVVAPQKSPNTDGIHITRTSNIKILESVIRTGDDCVSIVNGSRNVVVRNIVCGPGHGISIGSLGEDNKENYVSNIFVKGVTFRGTTNGVRIKTWQGGSGIARNIVFEDILMMNVHNPIIINQHYYDKNKICDKEKSAVRVENVVYRNIIGTSASKVAINLNCSELFPCKNVVLQNVMLSAHQKGEKVEASCSHLAMQTTNLNYLPTCFLNN